MHVSTFLTMYQPEDNPFGFFLFFELNWQQFNGSGICGVTAAFIIMAFRDFILMTMSTTGDVFSFAFSTFVI